MSGPSAPTGSGLKKKICKRGKGDLSKVAKELLEDSPVNITKGLSETPATSRAKTRAGCSSAVGARRKLDLSNINLSSLSTRPGKVTNIGAIHYFAREHLATNNNGKIEINVDCILVRWPEELQGFKFFLFADHTGCFSIGTSVDTFEILKPVMEDPNSSIPGIKLSGNVLFKWSTKAAGESGDREIYFNARKGSLNVSLTSNVFLPQVFSSFHTIRKIIGMPYNSSVKFPVIFGDCMLQQNADEGKKRSFMVQDPTGYAVVHVLNWCSDGSENEIRNPAVKNVRKVDHGPMIFRGRFQFEVIDVEDTKAISTTVDRSEIDIGRTSHETLTRQINLIKSTKSNDYMFAPEDEFDIRK